MLSKVGSFGLVGLQGHFVQVEVDVSGGLPAYETVGLPDAAVRESKERVRSAIRNSGFEYPVGRVTVSLAPADLKKEGSVYDLPIAVGLMAATGQIPAEAASKYLFIGELALSGEVREVAGALPMLLGAKAGGHTSFVLPEGNVPEVSYIEGITLIPIKTLYQLAAFLRGEQAIEPAPYRSWGMSSVVYGADFAEIKGQQGAKRAAEVAVAGGHHMLLFGTPGSGKTMLARSIPSILPELTLDEALEITKLHSITGMLKAEGGVVRERPFRAPHHSASVASLVGGGQNAMPGEISLAHYGVLFLDEFPEFRRDVMESLRQPLEDGHVTIARANNKAIYPAEFMLVAAMNPCPCGNFGSRINECRCTAAQINRYRSRISGPMLDRIDLHIEMTEVGYGEITGQGEEEPSAAIRSRVNAARSIQRERYRGEGIFFNAQLNSAQLKKFCITDERGEVLLRRAFESLKLSARAYNRVLKVSRTIADLDGSELILSRHVAEAVQYRSVDSKYWGR